MPTLNWDSDLGSYSFNDAQALQERVIGVWLVDYTLLSGFPYARISCSFRYRTLGEYAPDTATLRVRHGGTAVRHFGSVFTNETSDGALLNALVLSGAYIGAWDDFGSEAPPANYPGFHSFTTTIALPTSPVAQVSMSVQGIASQSEADQSLEIVGLGFTVQGTAVGV